MGQRTYTHCLTHQLPEDQASRVGLVCVACKQRLYTAPPDGNCLSYWESQPGAYSLDRRPCWVYTLNWPEAEWQIRSLHPAEAAEAETATAAPPKSSTRN